MRGLPVAGEVQASGETKSRLTKTNLFALSATRVTAEEKQRDKRMDRYDERMNKYGHCSVKKVRHLRNYGVVTRADDPKFRDGWVGIHREVNAP